MAAKKTVNAKRDHVVISVRRRGLDQYVRVRGPFTNKEANTVAFYVTREDGDDCSVEMLEPLCQHNQWILEGDE